MRHRIHLRKLNRTSEHRRALLRNMAQSLIEHGQITTTIPKAKNLRPYIERIVTLAVKSRKFAAASDTAGALRARRGIHQLLGDRGIIPKEHRAAYEEMSDARRAKTLRMASGRRYRTGEAKGRLDFTAESVTHRLLETIAPRYESRPGGYTRIICLAKKRIGDAAQLAVIQFVGDEEVPTSLTRPSKSGRQTRTNARYAMAVKLSKKRGRGEKKQAVDKPDVEPDTTEGDSATEAKSGE